MKQSVSVSRSLCTIVLCLMPLSAAAESFKVAVASNFKPAMESLVRVFEERTRHDASVSYGSTGKHYAQLVNGAPFDLFLSADSGRVQRLEESGKSIPDSRFTYAVGKLVLWGPNAGFKREGGFALQGDGFRFLAIANPRTAPYGRAAEQTLRRMQLWETLQSRIVRGENVAQAFAYVRSGNADMGLLAMSQVTGTEEIDPGSIWVVPQEFYEPIEQQAVLLTLNQAAQAFVEFLRGSEAGAIITAYGYALP